MQQRSYPRANAARLTWKEDVIPAQAGIQGSLRKRWIPACAGMTNTQTVLNMTDKQPDETWEDLAERRIQEGVANGEFDHLPGFGRPIPGIDEVLDENWWVKAMLRREQIAALPPIMEARLARERLLEGLAQIDTIGILRERIEAVNDQIRRAHFSHIAGPADGVFPLCEEEVIATWKVSHEIRTE